MKDYYKYSNICSYSLKYFSSRQSVVHDVQGFPVDDNNNEFIKIYDNTSKQSQFTQDPILKAETRNECVTLDN